LPNITGCECSSLTRVFYVRDFGTITPLFSDHTGDIGVPENNRVALSKPQMENTESQKLDNTQRNSQAV
jgi:hypothetical protein